MIFTERVYSNQNPIMEELYTQFEYITLVSNPKQEFERRFRDELHQYLEQEDIEQNCDYHELGAEPIQLPDEIYVLPMEIIRDFYWLYVNFVRFRYFDESSIRWDTIPSYHVGGWTPLFFQTMQCIAVCVIRAIWFHEEGGYMLPEEEHALDAFLMHYFDFLISSDGLGS